MIEYSDSYVVFKDKEVKKYLDKADQIMLNILHNKIMIGRLNDNLDADQSFIVVGEDKPYYEKIKLEVDKEEYFYHY